jgi:hypothetical protein
MRTVFISCVVATILAIGASIGLTFWQKDVQVQG